MQLKGIGIVLLPAYKYIFCAYCSSSRSASTNGNTSFTGILLHNVVKVAIATSEINNRDILKNFIE